MFQCTDVRLHRGIIYAPARARANYFLPPRGSHSDIFTFPPYNGTVFIEIKPRSLPWNEGIFCIYSYHLYEQKEMLYAWIMRIYCRLLLWKADRYFINIGMRAVYMMMSRSILLKRKAAKGWESKGRNPARYFWPRNKGRSLLLSLRDKRTEVSNGRLIGTPAELPGQLLLIKVGVTRRDHTFQVLFDDMSGSNVYPEVNKISSPLHFDSILYRAKNSHLNRIFLNIAKYNVQKNIYYCIALIMTIKKDSP